MRHAAQVDTEAIQDDYELGLVYAKNLVDEDQPLLIVWRPSGELLADFHDLKSENTKGPVRAPHVPCIRRKQ
jgi:hypothetical protein